MLAENRYKLFHIPEPRYMTGLIKCMQCARSTYPRHHLTSFIDGRLRITLPARATAFHTFRPCLAPTTTKLEDLQEESLSDDERVKKLGKAFHDEYSKLKSKYRTPKHPIVLCHGLLGFDSMRLGEFEPLSIPPLAVIHYWKGIKEALEANGNEVFITRVPRTATVEERAEILAKQIQDHFGGRSINLIGHSMVWLPLVPSTWGGTDASIKQVQILTTLTGRHGLSVPHLQHETRLQDPLLDNGRDTAPRLRLRRLLRREDWQATQVSHNPPLRTSSSCERPNGVVILSSNHAC